MEIFTVKVYLLMNVMLVGGIGIGYDFGSIRADISAHRWHDIDSFSVGGHKYDSDVNNYFGESA
ncbi:hypothetical protein PMIT1303_01820 [Prochlorococcus sp. MIT 1303]|nr:hypothetical protein PMIT1303_01820 [Prochlorococcus sp. MIT 1303]